MPAHDPSDKLYSPIPSWSPTCLVETRLNGDDEAELERWGERVLDAADLDALLVASARPEPAA